MIAVIDEAAPEDRRGIYYVVTAAILPNATDVRMGLPPSFLTDPGKVPLGVKASHRTEVPLALPSSRGATLK
jgi:hypothetical protein